MKDALEISSLIVELRSTSGDGRSIGTWPWPEAVPQKGHVIEHDGSEYEVMSVRWSTAGPRQVQVHVRELGLGQA